MTITLDGEMAVKIVGYATIGTGTIYVLVWVLGVVLRSWAKRVAMPLRQLAATQETLRQSYRWADFFAHFHPEDGIEIMGVYGKEEAMARAAEVLKQNAVPPPEGQGRQA